MRVRVVPVQPGAVANVEGVAERRAARDERAERAVVAGVIGEAVPMDDGRIRHRIRQREVDALPTLDDQGRIEEVALAVGRRESARPRRRGRGDARPDVERDGAVCRSASGRSSRRAPGCGSGAPGIPQPAKRLVLAARRERAKAGGRGGGQERATSHAHILVRTRHRNA
jgi:hypothetical protein